MYQLITLSSKITYSENIFFRWTAVLFDHYVSADEQNATRHLLYFDQGALGLGFSTRNYFLDDSKHSAVIAAYVKRHEDFS